MKTLKAGRVLAVLAAAVLLLAPVVPIALAGSTPLIQHTKKASGGGGGIAPGTNFNGPTLLAPTGLIATPIVGGGGALAAGTYYYVLTNENVDYTGEGPFSNEATCVLPATGSCQLDWDNQYLNGAGVTFYRGTTSGTYPYTNTDLTYGNDTFLSTETDNDGSFSFYTDSPAPKNPGGAAWSIGGANGNFIWSNVIEVANITSHNTNLKGSTVINGTLTSSLAQQLRLAPVVVPSNSNSDVYPAFPAMTTHVDSVFGVGNLSIAAPAGSGVQEGEQVILRINTTNARTYVWDAIYRGGTGLPLPATTVAAKTNYLTFIYNAADTKWDLILSVPGL